MPLTCRTCAHDNPESNRYCGTCGATLTSGSPASLVPTEFQVTNGSSSSSPSTDDGRFVPGTLLAARYRIVSLVGCGGMGEVYRATDLKLNQPVALKFLPEGVGDDPRALARFHNEVRTARQIAHPSVCRVYDIGEVDGHHYISMEYIDGEDLRS